MKNINAKIIKLNDKNFLGAAVEYFCTHYTESILLQGKLCVENRSTLINIYYIIKFFSIRYVYNEFRIKGNSLKAISPIYTLIKCIECVRLEMSSTLSVWFSFQNTCAFTLFVYYSCPFHMIFLLCN